jgi:hypothetical protein
MVLTKSKYCEILPCDFLGDFSERLHSYKTYKEMALLQYVYLYDFSYFPQNKYEKTYTHSKHIYNGMDQHGA